MLCLLFVPGIVFDLGIHGNLHVEGTVGVIWDDMAVIVDTLTLRVKDATLAVTVDLDALIANVTDRVGLVWVRIDVENRVGGMSLIRAGSSGASCRRMGSGVGSRERATSNERTADGENDAHGHGGGKNGGHAGAGVRVCEVGRRVREVTL